MIEQPPKEEVLSLIKAIESRPAITQRDLSKELDVSLGKINYLLNELIKKGFIKIKNFSKNPGKLQKIHYILTKEGFEQKTWLTYHFLKKKETEYNNIRREWENLTKSTPTISAR